MEWLPKVLLLVLANCSCTGASFINTPMETEVCAGTNANLSWSFTNAGAQLLVQWTLNVSTTVARRLGGSNFLPGTGYAGRLQEDGNGGLIITSVTSADSGTYKCAVSYSDATPPADNEVTLSVYSVINTPLQITEGKSGSSVTLSSSLTDSSITYTWTTPNGNDLGTPITVNSNGNYTLCISGGRAQCLSPSLSSCVSYEVSGVVPTEPDVCPLLVYAILPVLIITLFVTLLVIGVTYHVGKGSKLQEGSLKESCGYCPSDNTFCMVVCPLFTDALCTGSKKTGLSTTAKNVISVVVFLCVAAVIGVIIAFGLGLESGKCILALILSIVCGLALMAIFTVSVYPHWPCLPEKGENGGNCFRTCRISTVEEPNRPAENQASPNRHTSRSPQASASEVRLTTEGRSPRPLPAIGSEAKQLPPISFEQSTLKNKQVGAPLPEIPKSNKLPPVDTVNNEEDKPKRRKKKKKKREEDEEEDKRDSQNSGGQANVEEED